MRFFRADAAFAIPELYEMLEAESYFYTIRLKGKAVLQEAVSHLLKRPVGSPPNYVRRFYHDVEYKAASWGRARRVIAKVEWHPGDLFPRVGFVVTNLPMEPDWVIRFYNQRGTAEQHLPEEVADWSLTSIQSRLIKIGARVVRHARKITFQLAEVAVPRNIFGKILAAIRALKPPPGPA
jgi:hypothetical protein